MRQAYPNPTQQLFPLRVLIFLSILIVLLLPQLRGQQPLADSLKQEWAEIEVGEEQLTYLLELIDQTNKRDFEGALALANYGIEICDAEGDELWLAQLHNAQSRSLQLMSQYDEALVAIDRAIAYGTSAGNTKVWAYSMNAKAVVFIDKGDYHGGLELYMEVLQAREELGDQEGIAYSNMKVSEVLFFLERFEESARYAVKAVELSEAIDDQEYLVQACEQAALALMETGQKERGLAYINQALAIVEAYDMGPRMVGSIQNSRGNVLRKFKRYEEAIAAYEVAYAIAIELNYESGAAASLGNIGDVYYLMEDYESALLYRKEAVEMKEKNGLYINYTENLLQLSTLYKEAGDFEQALLYHEKVLAFRDSTFNKDKAAITQELTMRYETQKKEEQIAQNEREQQFLYVIIGLMLIGVLLLVWAFVQKQRSNKALIELNEQKAFLIKEVHHRVKNNLQLVSSLLQFQSRNISDKGIKAALQDSQLRVHSMSLIHQKLYRGAHLAAIEMKSYLGNLAETLIDAYDDEEVIDVVLEMDDIELDVDYAIPLGLIANELMTNSLKYAFPADRKGAIKIQLAQEGDQLVLRVADNGVGKSTGPQREEAPGFGSELIEMLRVQLRGELVQSSEEGLATQLRFPYSGAA